MKYIFIVYFIKAYEDAIYPERFGENSVGYDVYRCIKHKHIFSKKFSIFYHSCFYKLSVT